MKNPAKAIKIVSIIVLIYGILLGIGGILLTAGGGIGTSFVGDNSEAINSAIAENSEASSYMNEINNTFGTDAKPAEAAVVVTSALLVLGIVFVISAIFDIIAAVLGLKAAKGGNPNPAFIFGIIDIVLSVISIVTSKGNYDIFSVISLIIGFAISAIYTYAAYQLKKQRA